MSPCLLRSPWARTSLVVLFVATCQHVGANGFEAGLERFRAADYLTAAELWKTCAIAGHPACQYGLGVLYDEGRGQPQDSRSAVIWLQRAARQKFTDAQIQLGFIYAIGRNGVAQDPVEAYAWFSVAAANGHAEAQKHRNRVAELLTPEELDAAVRRRDELSVHYELRESP